MPHLASRRRPPIALLALLSLSCQPATEPVEEEPAAPAEAATATPPVVQVRTTDYAFHAPPEADVDLEPGRYAWISEGYAQQGLVEEFRIE